MAEEIKFTDEELKSLQDLSQSSPRRTKIRVFSRNIFVKVSLVYLYHHFTIVCPVLS